jgi:hypothetical protein
MESARKSATISHLTRRTLPHMAAIALVAFSSFPEKLAAMTPLSVATALVPPAFGADLQNSSSERLPGHTLQLTLAVGAQTPPPAVLDLTVTLRRDDETGFQAYLRDIYDPRSPNFHHYLSQVQIAEQFGPSRQAYDELGAYLRAQKLATVQDSANRLTLTVNGSRSDAERAFGVHVGSYTIGARTFYANDRDPTLPPALAAHVLAISGLSSLAQPRSVNQTLPPADFTCPNSVSAEDCNLYGPICELYSATRSTGELLQAIGSAGEGAKDLTIAFNSYSQNLQLYFEECLTGTFSDAPIRRGPAIVPDAPQTGVPWHSVDGSNQTVGIVAFDNFQTYDIANYLSYTGAPAAQINNLSIVNVGAGASFGAAESEVLLDIDTVMSLAPASKIIIYSSGFPGSGSSFQGVFNKMLSDGLVTIISNSWAYCEDQTSLADVQSIDSILQSAAVAGISVFSGSGDSGSTCLDGRANTVAVPADSPNITAVGGTTLKAGAGGVYKGETWWDGTAHTPPSGQGGFGVSQFFGRPTYQNGHTVSAKRSVPDVSAAADPVNGLMLCQTDAGGCPTGSLYGGTSMAAPEWAAFTALLNQSHGSNFGFMNAALYPLSASNGFHNAVSMGSDFAHVGLGSPNVNALSLLLSGQSPGIADASQSRVLPTASGPAQFANVPGVPADGSSAAVVVVTLRDANGNTVPGKTVTLQGNAGNHVTIAPASGMSSVNDGTVQFTVTDLTSETVTFKATDTSDAVIVTQQPSMAFVTPPAAFSSIVASPTYPMPVASDGVATATITVTLEDSLHRPTPGKSVQLYQQHNSVIVTGNPATTDASGQASFNVADQVAETVNYVAVDQSDGNLTVNGSTNVLFSGTSISCTAGPVPQAGPGYRIDVYASGFPVQNGTSYGGINIFACVGVAGIAFDGAGNLFASDYITGDVYKFPPGGGVASNATKLAMNVGQGLGALTYGADGNLYGVRVATTGNYSTGAVVKIDQTTGAPTTVASALTCPSNLATDPVSGDLFVPDFCGSPADSPTVLRVADPGGVSPTVSGYANSEGAPNGSVSTAPDGTLYAVSAYPPYGQGRIDEISATNAAQPPTVTPTGVYSTYSAAAFGSNPDGGAQALITSVFNTGGFANSVAAYDMTAAPPAYSGATLVEADIGSVKILDASGCLYLTDSNIVYKVSNADGSCPLAGVASNPSVVLTPEIVLDNLSQGTLVNFDVTFPHTSLPQGTPVHYAVTGANRVEGVVLVNFNGRALIIYAGQIEGEDTMIAYADIDGTPVASNPVVITWHANKHVTRIDLNNNITSASLGSSVMLAAKIFDVSLPQISPIPSVAIQFNLSGQTCSAMTNGVGVASCSLTVSARTQCTLKASFAGNPTYLASTASLPFTVSKYDVLFANGFEGPLFDGSCVLYN